MDVTVDSRRVFAYTGGKPFDAALPSVVFLHGALHDHSVWTLLARWCAHHGHNALALDLPGHGRSDGPPLPDIESLADWTLSVMDAAGSRSATLVGHSMGTLVALEAAARAPERIDRLVLVGTAYPMRVSEALLNTARDHPLKAIDLVNALSLASLASKPSYPGPGMWLHGSNRALMRRSQARDRSINLFHHDFALCDRYAGGFEAAAKVQCPVHAVLGRQDQMTAPKAAQALVAALKAKVHLLDSGHTLMAEQPDGVLQALKEALG